MTTKLFYIITIFTLCYSVLLAEEPNNYHNIDKIVSVVGDSIILESDVQGSLIEMERQHMTDNVSDTNANKCKAFNALIMQKFLLIKAHDEGIQVDDNQVEENIDRRINFFAKQVGSLEVLEKQYLGKPLLQFKEEMKPKIRESMLAEKAQAELLSKVTISPIEVEDFYNKIPTQDIPLIDAEVTVGQIVVYPRYSESDLLAAKNKLEAIRERILAGEDFGLLASLYSQDPGSSHNNGEIGFFGHAEMVPEFEAAAFKLSKPGEVSPIIKSPYGFHIIQLIARKGQLANVRHILIKPTFSQSQVNKAKEQLTNILNKLKNNELNFEQAAVKYTDNEITKQSLGFFVDPETRSNKLKLDKLFEIDKTLTNIVSKLHPGEYSDILAYTDPNDFEQKQGYRIIYLKSYTKPHKMNLDTDYEQIQNMALSAKKNNVLNDWFRKQEKNIYLNVQDEYKSCLNKDKLF